MRRLIVDSIRKDPDWKNGDYTTQPKSAAFASVFYGVATAGGSIVWAKAAPTREAADKLLDTRLGAPSPPTPTTRSTMGSVARLRPVEGSRKIRASVLAIIRRTTNATRLKQA